jgi:hypothetical protein
MNSPLDIFKLKPAISNSLTVASLLLSATALINAGDSKAATSCLLTNLSTCTLTLGDKKFDGFQLMNYTPSPTDSVKVTKTLSGIWRVTATFDPERKFLGQNPAAKLAFNAMITDPTQQFFNTGIFNTTDTTFGGSSTAKATYSNLLPGGSGVAMNPLMSMNGAAANTTFGPNPTSVSVALEWFTVGNATMSDITSTFTQTDAPIPAGVPAPLPLIGAGAAFGFSRRLRRRIKTSATA